MTIAPNWLKISKGLIRYSELMTLYKCSRNIEKDYVFQSKYRVFYGLNAARKSDDFYGGYFRLLRRFSYEEDCQIEFVLRQLIKIEDRKELSFASKLIATIDPKRPIWDSRVRNVLNSKYGLDLKKTFSSVDDCVEAYNRMSLWYRRFLRSNEAKTLIKRFDNKFPNYNITPIKKIDFIFWQTPIE